MCKSFNRKSKRKRSKVTRVHIPPFKRREISRSVVLRESDLVRVHFRLFDWDASIGLIKKKWVETPTVLTLCRFIMWLLQWFSDGHEINDFSYFFHWISASCIWMTGVWLLISPLERLGMWPWAARSLECLYPALQPCTHETPRSMHSWLSCWDRVGVCVKADLESWKATLHDYLSWEQSQKMVPTNAAWKRHTKGFLRRIHCTRFTPNRGVERAWHWLPRKR